MFTLRLWVTDWHGCPTCLTEAIETTVRAEVIQVEREPPLDLGAGAFALTVWLEPFPWIVPKLRDKEPE